MQDFLFVEDEHILFSRMIFFTDIEPFSRPHLPDHFFVAMNQGVLKFLRPYPSRSFSLVDVDRCPYFMHDYID